MSRIIIEVCIDSVASAIAAEVGGADRVELCADLFSGGITPSAGMIATVRRSVTIGLMVMIRPRGGDFCYSEAEFEIMKHDIGVAKELGADGVVFGILHEDGTIDVTRTRELVTLARPMSVTFHRAFDMAAEPLQALEDVIATGADRLLTSGQEQTAYEGLDLIAELVKLANGRIVIFPGGGITERNLAKIVAGAGVKECHTSARASQPSRMAYRRSGVYMGGALRGSEFDLSVADAGRVQALRQIMDK
ncbi:MAG: copper homeostasis protein CutC [Bacillota bacterium]